MALERELKSKNIDISILSAIGVLGLITSILIGLLAPDTWVIAIIVGMFSCTAFILLGIESLHKTIIRNNAKKEQK